jgi:uncharacterized membrane protein
MDLQTWIIFKLHLIATLWMVGLIWFVQIVHYPLMARVGQDHFLAYQQGHTDRTVWVTAPIMLLELLLGLLLLAKFPDEMTYLASALTVVNWLSTFLIQIPCHEKLMQGFDAETHRWLVKSNWIRTIAWSGRGLIVTFGMGM